MLPAEDQLWTLLEIASSYILLLVGYLRRQILIVFLRHCGDSHRFTVFGILEKRRDDRGGRVARTVAKQDRSRGIKS